MRGKQGTWRHQRRSCGALRICVACVPLVWGGSHRTSALGWLWWRAWSALVAQGAAALCVAGAGLGDVHVFPLCGRRHLVTSQLLLRGSPGTCSHRRCLCVACVACVASGTYGLWHMQGWLWWRTWSLWRHCPFARQVWHCARMPACRLLAHMLFARQVFEQHHFGLRALALLDCRFSHHITLDFVLWRAFHCHVRRCQHVVKATLGI